MFTMLFLLVQLYSQESHRLWTTPLMASDRWVVLSDAWEFGISPEATKANYRLAASHQLKMQDEVFTWNKGFVIRRWQEECYWRFKCWDLLDDVLNCHYTPCQKLEKLYQLRSMLGDDDYFQRRMPHPIPSYRR